MTAAAEAEREAAKDTMVKDQVGPDDIADVVGSWTGIPAGRLLEGRHASSFVWRPSWGTG